MMDEGKRRGAVAVSDLASSIIDPILRRRAGINIELVQSWPDIVGEKLADATQLEKIQWQRRISDEDPFEPATLVIACSGFAALHIQHQTTEILSRVNSFLGFNAVARVKIVQKAVPMRKKQRPVPRSLTAGETQKIAALTEPIEDERLRESLKRLGASILARNARK